MNPPNTAQIVKIRLLVKVLPSESLLSLSVTLGILNLKKIQGDFWQSTSRMDVLEGLFWNFWGSLRRQCDPNNPVHLQDFLPSHQSRKHKMELGSHIVRRIIDEEHFGFGNSIIFWQQELLWFSPVPVRPFIELFCCFHGQDMKNSSREDETR